MGRGRTYRSELVRERDKTTGVEVVRLSDDMGDTIHPYFTQPLISEDGKILLVESNRTGFWQLYSLEMNTGLITQLTDDPDIEPHRSCLDPDALVAYYFSRQVLKSVELSTLRTQQIYVIPDDFRASILSLSSDGRFLAFSYVERLVLSPGMEVGEEEFYRRPHSLVIRIDLEKQRAEAIWGETEWISHVSISPVDTDIILFCHEGPWHLVQRMWIVRADTHEVWPLLHQQRHLEIVGHEFFTRSGKVAAQYGRRPAARAKEWERYDVIVDTDGSGLRKFRYPAHAPVHVQSSSDEILWVGDRAYPSADFSEGKCYIGLIRHVDDCAEVELLCRHDTSWESQTSHPHPIFAPDDRYVIFTSDRGGRCNVYMAEVASKR